VELFGVTENRVQQQLTALRKKVQIHEGVPEKFENTQGRPCIFILDNLLNEVFSRAVCDLFTEGSHHKKFSVILITENVLHQAPHCCDISLNAKYFVAFKTFVIGTSSRTSHDKCFLKTVPVNVKRIERQPRIRTVI